MGVYPDERSDIGNPMLSRFLSPDPGTCPDERSDIGIQAPSSAISHNRYAYCMNNPFMYTDPTGNKWYEPWTWSLKRGWDNVWEGLNNFAEWADRTDWFPSSGYISSSNFNTPKTNYNINYPTYLDIPEWGSLGSTYNMEIGWDALDFDYRIHPSGGGSYGGGQGGLGGGSGLGASGNSGGVSGGLGSGFSLGGLNYSGPGSSELGFTQPSQVYSSGSDYDWINTGFNHLGKTAYVAGLANKVRGGLEWEYLRQARFNRGLSGNFSQPIRHSLRAISKTGKVFGVVGTVATYGVAGYKVAIGRDNTSTWVDVGFTTGVVVVGIISAPVAVGTGIVYGGVRLFWGSEIDGWLDEKWGYR